MSTRRPEAPEGRVGKAAGNDPGRTTELRLAVQPAESPPDGDWDPPDAVVGLLLDAFDGYQVRRVSNDDPGTWLICGDAGLEVGTVEYARRGHGLVQRLLDTGAFARAEADLPVTTYEDRTAGVMHEVEDAPNLPGTERPGWAREAIRCPQAWAVPAAPRGTRRGGGVRVGHPDTGYTVHRALGRQALDLDHDRDVIDEDDDALDPLVPSDQSPWPIPTPGHGTKTASVIAGRGGDDGEVLGVAPEATLVPIRAVESVVQFFDSDVARAVDHARATGCRVVSMSLGGKGFFGLESAIRRAVDSGMIVMAAAGNRVGVVVAPASYPTCIAVAATGIGDRTWPGSSRGSAVDVSAPGWSVHVASFDWRTAPPDEVVRRSSGTSYAVAHLAGVAALWIGHHTPAALEHRFGRHRIQAAFLHLLRTVGCRVPAGWDGSRWGAGIVDAEAMVRAPLPTEDEVAGTDELMMLDPGEAPLDRLARLVDVDRAKLRLALGHALRLDQGALDEQLARFEGELAYLLLEDAAFRDGVLGGAATRETAGASTAVPAPAAASPDLAALLARS